MLCPFCRSPLDAGAPECPACRVTFPRTSALLGVLPRLSTGISDGGHLGPQEITKLLKAKETLERKFPQVTLQVVIHSFPAEQPFSLHVFWIFNAASFAGDTHRGAENHTVLLAVDPGRAEGGLMVGYGLEPFVSREALDHLLELAGPAWQIQRWLDGILTVVAGLDRLLESVAELDEAGAGDEF